MVTGDAINGLPAERDTHLGDVALKASTFRRIVKFGKFRFERSPVHYWAKPNIG